MSDNQLFIAKSLKKTLHLIKGLDDEKIPTDGKLVLYIDIDNETTDLRHEPLMQTRDETDGGNSGNPVP